MSKDVKVKRNKKYDTFSITMELERPLLYDEVENKDDKNNNRKFNIKNKRFKGIGILFVLILLGFFIWINKTYEPQKLAKEALVSNSKVEVTVNENISFTPKGRKVSKGLILYPGAKVEIESYAPLARKIAESGYEVVIVKMPLNLAILGTNKAQKVMDSYNNIEHWVIGGHSLGGVAASNFARDNKLIEGVVFLASYPMGDELKELGKKVISIWGSKDGVVNFKSLVESKQKLPDDTTYVEIEGGNHAQFGDYGKQKGDNDAIISQEKQLNITANSIIKFLKNIS
ncbi:alpha/beta hydrolase [Clostridioides difficile]|uniref:alpha/beta hydrolase n=1 Tax=Clostridioides difficile TaxID=1496 RepID=UPI001596E8AA|nr:alpha/beta hydrolase [Clostridioides difficile]